VPQIAPDDAHRWLTLGLVLHMLGQTKKAMEILLKARDACCDSAEIANHINSIKQNLSMRIAQNRGNKSRSAQGLQWAP
jgi:hypothetical protein